MAEGVKHYSTMPVRKRPVGAGPARDPSPFAEKARGQGPLLRHDLGLRHMFESVAILRLRRAALGILLTATLLSLPGCSGDPGVGPKEVNWDREACHRCRMVLSDRLHSAQIRVGAGGERSKVYPFDDIGCALIWLEDQPFRDAPDTEIWVNDWRSGDWIDAREATYLPGQVTPMEYGLGAQLEPAPGGLGFAQAKAHVFDTEARFNQHAAHLREAAEQRAAAEGGK